MKQQHSPKIYALHGFLGIPDDWNRLQLPNIDKVDLYADLFTSPDCGLNAWAESFNAYAAESHQAHPKILLGYSLGGRLALHALIARPKLWDAAIIISANPGGLSHDEKLKRCQNDEAWANRFLTMDWTELMTEWNASPVFKGTVEMPRVERDYDRNNLASTLKFWSLGNQEDFRGDLTSLRLPILWMTGENDQAFGQIANQISLSHPKSKKIIVSDAGHRLPWDRPNQVESEIANFISNLTKDEQCK